MIQVGDLVKHKHIGGLGLVKSINTVVVKDSGHTKNQYQTDTDVLRRTMLDVSDG